MREQGNEEARRRKLRLLLTLSEREKLDAAVTRTGTTRSLLILQAIQVGLADPSLKTAQERRSRRTDAWIPSPIKRRLRELASTLNVTQQHLTRHLLLAYLESAPWNQSSPQPQTEPGTDGGVKDAA